MVKLGVIYSGSKWQHDLFTLEKYQPFISDIIHACALPTTDLRALDVLMVPRESNQEMLLKAKEGLIQFLDRGGLLISFGEVTMPWLPYCIWENEYPQFRYEDETSKWDKGDLVTEPYRMLKPEHPLLSGLEIEDLQWHFHGIFHAPQDAEVLLRYGKDGDVIYIDSNNFKGKIMTTTLDPDVHFGYGVVKKTQKFLDKVFKWAITDLHTGN
jgi:hypothetical protein